MASLQELLDEHKFRKCRGPENPTTDDLVEAFDYFCSNFVYIKHPSQGKIQLNLRDAQREAVRAWIDKRYTIVLKSRYQAFCKEFTDSIKNKIAQFDCLRDAMSYYKDISQTFPRNAFDQLQNQDHDPVPGSLQ